MTSDFSAACVHLERAYYYLRGDDETSRAACDTLDLLIETVTEALHKRPKAGVLEFPQSTTRQAG
ncbi:hypothetical protein OOJ09_21920 [Mesorhizobium qingshengii]|uniref:Uncharacterized protein n=1 Tax=Mesorhizobium qingshengii TaxID=1165689 RepID=A0ABT4QZ38_9HYPH|nr:hypothetical protein [Mesorhizobium qingshengii]MCZ8546854.1 hypothetical protein [Mesorhizobium qingshengii]